MSEMEFHTGTARQICRLATGFRAKIEMAIKLHGLVLPDEDSYDEVNFDDEYCSLEGFAYFGGHLWKIEDTKHEDYVEKAVEISADVFEYVLHYYNGGAGFEEVLESAIQKAKRKKK